MTLTLTLPLTMPLTMPLTWTLTLTAHDGKLRPRTRPGTLRTWTGPIRLKPTPSKRITRIAQRPRAPHPRLIGVTRARLSRTLAWTSRPSNGPCAIEGTVEGPPARSDGTQSKLPLTLPLPLHLPGSWSVTLSMPFWRPHRHPPLEPLHTIHPGGL